MVSPPLVPRTIIHVDLDAFYCAVEELSDPTLQGRAFAVGGRADERGVVASGSYAARSFGVRSAMAMGMAQRLCPHLLVVAPRHADYRAVSNSVMELLRSFTPQLEQLSIDEAFLDVSVMCQNGSAPRELALTIQHRVAEELGLSCSLGVASNKMVAKIATDCGKAGATVGRSPRALCVVEAGEEAAFLAPLPVSALWGVGPKLEAKLRSLGIDTIGALSRWDERDLAHRFGKHGVELAKHARGIDRREVTTERERKSVSSETTFLHDVGEWETLHSTLCEQAASVATQLRGQNLRGTTVKLKLRWSDFSYSTRQTTLPVTTDTASIIEEAATALLRQVWVDAVPVRLLGVGVSGLSPVRQLALFDDVPDSEEAVSSAQNEEALAEHGGGDAMSEPSEMTGPSDRQQRLNEALGLLEARFGRDRVRLGMRPPSP